MWTTRSSCRKTPSSAASLAPEICEVQGIEGPANFTSGSGDVHASEINKDVQIVCGSGDVVLSKVKGQVQVNTGSGDVSLDTIGGQIRIQTGSGSIEITNPSQALEASTGSGDVTIKGASADIRVRTASGDVDVEGNPGGVELLGFSYRLGRSRASRAAERQLSPLRAFKVGRNRCRHSYHDGRNCGQA